MNGNGNRLPEIICSAVKETFEEMAFLEVIQHLEPPNGLDEPLDEASALRALLLIHDPFPGELCLTVPRPLISSVATTLFAMDQETVTDSTLLDLLSELLNTIAGRVMVKMTPDGTTFRLGLPETEVETLDPPDEQYMECYFDIDGQFFSLTASGDALLARGETC
jgi:hypothetical protein